MDPPPHERLSSVHMLCPLHMFLITALKMDLVVFHEGSEVVHQFVLIFPGVNSIVQCFYDPTNDTKAYMVHVFQRNVSYPFADYVLCVVLPIWCRTRCSCDPACICVRLAHCRTGVLHAYSSMKKPCDVTA